MRLEGAGLSLRPPTLADAELLLSWENDNEVVELSAHEGGLSLKDIEQYISSINDVYLDKQLRFIIHAQGQDLGTLDIFDVDFEAESAHVGILIADKSKRKAGIGTEAMNLLIAYCSDVLKLCTLFAEVQASNAGSQTFFKRLGFKCISTEDATLTYELNILRSR
jgi:diamine N-acetyltransferase